MFTFSNFHCRVYEEGAGNTFLFQFYFTSSI